MTTEFDRGVDQMEGRECSEWASVPYSAVYVEVIGPKESHICFFPNTPRGKQIANQVANEHNQYSTLIAQRERLIEALEIARKMFDYIVELPKIEQAQTQAEQGVRMINDFLAEVRDEFATRTTTGREG